MTNTETPRNERGVELAFVHEIERLGLVASGIDPDDTDVLNGDVDAGLFTLLVTVVREYAARTDYTNWRELASDISEQFPFGWINPNPDQLRYIESRSYVDNYNHQHGTPGDMFEI